jgi:hypothetical protein
MWLDLVAMIPDIPSNFPEFHEKRGGPTFAGVASAEPNEVGLWNAYPFDGGAAFKECKPPETVLSLNSFEQARKIGAGSGMGLGATPFGETMNNPKDNLGSGANRLEPRTERGHEEGPNEEDSRFLTEPNMTSILAVAAARASRGGLLFPVNHHRADRAMAGGVSGYYPAAAAHGEMMEGGFADVPIDAS